MRNVAIKLVSLVKGAELEDEKDSYVIRKSLIRYGC